MRKISLLLFPWVMVFAAVAISAQSRTQPFKFRMTPIDAKTHQPRSTFYLGESVAVRVSLTNHSRSPRRIPQLSDTMISLKLSSMLVGENGPDLHDSYYGGTGISWSSNGMWFWGDRAPVMLTIAPGQTVSEIIPDVGRQFHGHPLQEGSHIVTGKYNEHLRAVISFRIVVDEAKTFPLLEQLAAQPVHEGRDTVQRWASATLNLRRHPSISGRILDTEGRPLKEHVELKVVDTKEHFYEGRNDGRYRLDSLTGGATYTVTPYLPFYNHPGVADYTFEPESRTFSNVRGRITGVNFTATRIRVTTNVVLEEEGAKVKASSTRDDQTEPERVNDGYRMTTVGDKEAESWTDGTPHSFPDWIEVDFGRARSINWINVFTLPDDYKKPPEPDLKQKFSRFGITDFDVQQWTGRAWRTVPGGAIRNNRNVWRMIKFPELSTSKIRVVVQNALGGASRITEIEAIHLNDLPQPKIAVTGNSKIVATAQGYINSPMHFRTEAFDRDGTIRLYELDFGDKSDEYDWEFDSQKPNDKPRLIHSHTYEQQGTYKVRLKVADDCDEPNDATILVTITAPPKRTAVRNRSNH